MKQIANQMYQSILQVLKWIPADTWFMALLVFLLAVLLRINVENRGHEAFLKLVTYSLIHD